MGIDRVSGALRILAPEANWKEPEHLDARLQPSSPVMWTFKQHSAELTARGTLLVFDNATATRPLAGRSGATESA